MITNPTVANALQSALHGGEVSPVSNRANRRRTAHNARKPAVVLNVRPPSNPAKNRARKIVTAFAAALMLALAAGMTAHAELFERRTYDIRGLNCPHLEPHPVFRLPHTEAPTHIDNRGQLLTARRQIVDGECSEFAAASYAEFYLWRQFGIPHRINPFIISKHLKTKGANIENGIDIFSCLSALIDMGTVRTNITIRIVGMLTDRGKLKFSEDALKADIHKYGACLCALDATEDWLSHYVSSGRTGIRLGHITGDGKKAPGHAVVICGYDEWGVIFQNCWGTEWGENGFGIIRWDALARGFTIAAVLIDHD